MQYFNKPEVKLIYVLTQILRRSYDDTGSKMSEGSTFGVNTHSLLSFYKILYCTSLLQCRFRRANGMFTHFQKSSGAVCAMQNIRGEKTEEHERQTLMNELILTYGDLQQFSYITSHIVKARLANLISILSLLATSSTHSKHPCPTDSRPTRQLYENPK